LTSTSEDAGEFLDWLLETEAMLEFGKGGPVVPCGACNSCCRASMFIQIGPLELQGITRIPIGLLLPVRGLPSGHRVMGYDKHGACTLLEDLSCSIYLDRPQTCRNYDCRVFAATGIGVDESVQPEIAERVAKWRFEYALPASRVAQQGVKEAAAFVRENKALFPLGVIPSYPSKLALFVLRGWRLILSGHQAGCSDAEIVNSVFEMATRHLAR
jgi:Fe-S-cluster containining protein